MNVEHSPDRAPAVARHRRPSRIAVSLLGLVAVLAVVVVFSRGVVRGQALRAQPVFEFQQKLTGGSQLGVTVRDVEASDVRREKLPAMGGAAIDEVDSDGPAAKAGLRAGDVLVAFDGEKIRSARHLARLVEETPDGREVEAAVIRGGEKLTVKVTPTATRPLLFGGNSRFAAPETFKETFRLTHPDIQSLLDLRDVQDAFSRTDRMGRLSGFFGAFDRGRLGVGVQDLSGQLGEYFGASTGGVLITAVDDGTPARAAGLKAGDVITKINDESVRDSNDLRRRMSTLSGETRVTFLRDRKEQTVTIKIEDERVITRERIRK